jgi:hypothetical protein|tara:strand:- start:612 stop:776 length:165 start_codon:yes stop_codon:yes gene_type:complete
MDPKKWKSVVVPLDTYGVLKSMAKKEHRTISGQLTHVIQKWIEAEPDTAKGGDK